MSNVRAGVAYVDVRLGQVDKFMADFKRTVESATKEIGKRVGDDLAKSIPKGAGEKVGKVTAGNMSKAFFKDASTSFNAGFRALATGQIKTFSRFMLEAGAAGSLGLRSGLEAGLGSLGNSFKRMMGNIPDLANRVKTSVTSAFNSIPERVARAGQAVDGLSKRMGFLSFQLTNFGFIASTAFTAPVAAMLTFGAIIGIQTAASIEQATASLKALTPAGTDVEAVIKRLQALAKASPIFNTSDIVTFTQKMVASGLSVKATEEFLKSFANIALTVGADIGKIPFALEALVQMVGKGKVSMEELRLQLGDALPGAMTIVASALNVTTDELYKMVEAGELSGKELVAALTKLGKSEKYLKGAANGAATMGAKWQELKESVQAGLGEVFLKNADKIKKGLSELIPIMDDVIKESGPMFVALIKGFGQFIKGLAKVVDWYKELSPGTRDLVNTLALIAVVLGPVVILLGALGAAFAGITAMVAAVLTPVGAVIGAIIIFIIEIVSVINYLKGLYKEGGKFKEVWDNIWNAVMSLVKPLGEEFKKLWEEIKGAFDQLKNAFMENKEAIALIVDVLKVVAIVIGTVLAIALGVLFGILKGAISAIGPIIRAIASLVSGLIKIFLGLINFIVGVFTGDWKRAWDGIKSIWNGLWDAIVGTLVNLGRAILNLVWGFVTGIIDFFKVLFDVLVGNSIIPDMVNLIIDWFVKLINKGKTLFANLGAFFSAFYSKYVAPFVNSVKNGIDKVVTFFTSIPGKIKSAFASAGSWLINAGRNIVNGLVEGVRRMSGVLKNAILNLIPAPVRGIVESALGINSPSKVFKDIGKFLVLGLIEGVQSTTPKLMTEMNSLSNAIPEFASPEYDRRNPVEPRSFGAALQIENYYANKDSDPRREAEDWYFLVSSRGGVV